MTNRKPTAGELESNIDSYIEEAQNEDIEFDLSELGLDNIVLISKERYDYLMMCKASLEQMEQS